MPLDEIIVLDHFNSLDTDGVEQRDGIPSPNIKQGGSYAANICANFDNAIHAVDPAQTFNGCLQRFAMGFNKVEFAFVSSNLLDFTRRVDLFCIISCNKGQHGDEIRLATQRVKIGPLEVRTDKCQSKILCNMMHGPIGGQGTESLGHIVGDFVENGSENVDH